MTEFDPIKRIVEICQERNWTFYKLAKQSGIPYSTLSTMLKKTSAPSLPSIIRICEGFDISLSDFFSTDYRPALTRNEYEILELWGALDEKGKLLATVYMQGLRDYQTK